MGRAAELRALAGELLAGGRLVTLVGPGGMGKTRLAQEVARVHWRDCAADPDPGVLWVDLGEVAGEPGLLDAVGAALALSQPGAAADAASRIAGALAAAGPLLLVLDSADRVIEPAAEAAIRCCTAGPWPPGGTCCASGVRAARAFKT